jgi:hypothetical protein
MATPTVYLTVCGKRPFTPLKKSIWRAACKITWTKLPGQNYLDKITWTKLPGNRHYGFRCPFGAMACSEGVAAFLYDLPPHPYFGHNILVFIGLQTAFRCKIVKTKELPAKSSRIRS